MLTRTPYRHALLPALLLIALAAAPAAAAQDGRIAFTSSRDSAPMTNAPTELYVMNADGSGQTRLTTTAASEAAPDVSPDGRTIAYLSGEQLHVVGADGAGRRALTSGGGPKRDPAFTPDGARIVYGAGSELRSIGLDGGGDQLHATGVGGAVALHPAGALIAYECQGGEICLAGLDGSGAHAITSTAGAFENAPAFSPDGTRIAFSRQVDGTTRIVTADLAGGDVRVVTPAGGWAQLPAFSPDGSRIVFEGNLISVPGSNSGLHAIGIDGRGLSRLTCSPMLDSEPDWAVAVLPGDAGGTGSPCAPDSDQDGIADGVDRCPAERGPAVHQGCVHPPLTPENAYPYIHSRLGDPLRALIRKLRATSRRAIVRKGFVKASDVELLLPGRLTLEVRTAKGKLLMRGSRMFARAVSHEIKAKLRPRGRRLLRRPPKVRAHVSLRFDHPPGVVGLPAVQQLPVTLWRR